MTIWALLGVAILLCYLFFLNPVPDFYPQQQNDPFIYLSLASSLQSGGGYPTKHWMPGFPALLAVWTAAFGHDFALLKLCMVATGLLLVLACFAYYRSFLSRAEALGLALLVAVAPTIFAHAHRLMSEIPNTLFSTAALAVAQLLSASTAERSARKRVALSLLLVLACAASVLVRGNGLALAPALLAAALPLRSLNGPAASRVNWSLLAGAVAVVMVFALWTVRNRGLEFSGIDNITYLQEVQANDIGALWEAGGFGPGVEKAGWAQMAHRVKENFAWYHTYNVADSVMPGAGALRSVKIPFLGFGLALLIGLVVALGVGPLTRVSLAGSVYLVVSVLLVLIYPTGGAERMLVPCVPILVVAWYLGLRGIFGAEMAKGWILAAVCYGLIHCVLAGQKQQDHPYSTDSFGDFLAVLEEADSRFGGPGAVLVSQHPEVVHAMSRFRSPRFADAVRRLQTGELRHFLIVDEDELGTAAELPAELSRVALDERGGVRLWRVSRKTPPNQP